MRAFILHRPYWSTLDLRLPSLVFSRSQSSKVWLSTRHCLPRVDVTRQTQEPARLEHPGVLP